MKRRPALVVSEDDDHDLILLRITSKIRQTEMDVMLHEWGEAGLRLHSVVRLEKVVTSNESYVIKHLGTLSNSDALRVLSALKISCGRIVVLPAIKRV
jgi:mRNA-degrading endonuclease toxin of MazEF toxin-antitoxin module